jgi:hypothetical protein
MSLVLVDPRRLAGPTSTRRDGDVSEFISDLAALAASAIGPNTGNYYHTDNITSIMFDICLLYFI